MNSANIKSTGRSFLLQPITTREEAEKFLTELHRQSMMFHLEDDVWDVLWNEMMDPPSNVQIAAIERRRDEIYEADFDWGEYDCPLGFVAHLMEAD